MTFDLQSALDGLKGLQVRIEEGQDYPGLDEAQIVCRFGEEGFVKAVYWRLLTGGRHVLSSFDHRQVYGLPMPINATHDLRLALDGKALRDVQLDAPTGDIRLHFDDDSELQALNFTGYEVWVAVFGDGSIAYSNYYR